jgi:hypothetical protein
MHPTTKLPHPLRTAATGIRPYLTEALPEKQAFICSSIVMIGGTVGIRADFARTRKQ